MSRLATWTALVLVLTACSSTSTPTTTSTPPTTTLDVSWFTYEGPPSTHAALLSGVLIIDVEAHCVQVGDSQAVFPEGTTLDLSDPERPGLVLPNGRTVYSGDIVELGGGDIRFPAAGRAENCGTDRNFAVGY